MNRSATAPQASFTFDYDGGAESGDTDSFGNDYSSSADGILTITHAGGATINADQLGVSGSSEYDKKTWDEATDPNYGANSEISSGDRLDVWISSDDTISITWTNQQGTDSATLRKYSGPDA